MSLQNSHQISEVKVLLKKGADGSGIADIELTGQALNVDTYTITLTNGDKYTFDVTNGTSIASIEKTSTVGNVDTYTITLTDGSTSTFTVTNAYGATASDISYDNTASGLTGTNVQDAIDEVYEKDQCLVVDFTSFSSLPQTVSDVKIETDMVCVNSVLSNPSAQTGDWTVSTDTAGQVTVSGTISGSTTLTLYLMKSR